MQILVHSIPDLKGEKGDSLFGELLDNVCGQALSLVWDAFSETDVYSIRPEVRIAVNPTQPVLIPRKLL